METELKEIKKNLKYALNGFKDAKEKYGYDLANETYYIEQALKKVDLLNNTDTKQLNIVDTMPCFYHFDINRRVYEKDGIKSNAPFYEEHFVKINIIGETDKEYICQFGRTINKRSMLYKINSSTRVKVFTEQEKEDNIYIHSKLIYLVDLLRKSDANTLREVEKLLLSKKV